MQYSSVSVSGLISSFNTGSIVAIKEKLKTYVDKVHANGRKVRLWATPDSLLGFQALVDIGVDYIGTDKLSLLADYLKLGNSK